MCVFLRFAWIPILALPIVARDLREDLDAYLSRTRVEFSGNILIAKGSRVVLLESYGLAERNLGVRNQPDMLYRIGSLTKPITATMVMSLVEEGRVRLSDSICDRLRACPAAWKPVTIEYLLDHTSGVPDLFKELHAVPVLETRQELARVLGTSKRIDLESEPGAKYRYSNFNYVLLGALVEDVTGLSWQEQLQRRVFSPAKMERTRYDDVWTVIPGRVSGYTRKNGEIHPIPYKDHAAYAAGGLLSSAMDLFRFSQALFGGALLRADTLKEMTRPRLGNYGLGLQVIELNGRSAYNHTGGIDGFSSHLQYYPREQLTVIVLENVEDDGVKNMATEIAAIALK